jgi:formylglycine-generating enzyme required for sulfatase activity
MTTPSSPPSLAAQPALVQLPEGWFVMGHPQGLDCERPPHRVWVDAFSLAICPVTNAEYSLFLAAAQLAPPPFFSQPAFRDPQQPVVGVSWFEAVAYCEWLASVHGRHYRLPTEAEWERAARGGHEGALFPWGDDPPQSRPHYLERWLTGPERVGTSTPNGFGLHDMCENVHEWCSDWFDPDYYAHSPARAPRGPESSTRRASRGGSWRHHVKASRCHTRSSIPPAFQYADYGFRIAADAR